VANEKGRNKKKKEQKKKDRLFRLVGTDLCACSGGHQSKCDGVCREAHTNSKTGIVKCGEMYQIDQSELGRGNSRRPKRDWKFGKQKEVKDNKESKQERRQKRERDRYDG
jgi:hypothetical protein